MTFPEFCARQARRSTLLIVAAIAVIAGVLGLAAYRRRAAAGRSPEEADGA